MMEIQRLKSGKGGKGGGRGGGGEEGRLCISDIHLPIKSHYSHQLTSPQGAPGGRVLGMGEIPGMDVGFLLGLGLLFKS